MTKHMLLLKSCLTMDFAMYNNRNVNSTRSKRLRRKLFTTPDHEHYTSVPPTASHVTPQSFPVSMSAQSSLTSGFCIFQDGVPRPTALRNVSTLSSTPGNPRLSVINLPESLRCAPDGRRFAALDVGRHVEGVLVADSLST